MRFPFGKHRGKDLAEIPDTYLDWIIGEKWFVADCRNKRLLEEIGKELAIRKRSYSPVRDDWDRALQ